MKFILDNGQENHAFEIPHGAIIIGRDKSCDLTMKSQAISRRHAECLREGNVVRLRDLNSANGTYVNGMRIRTPVILKNDDMVQIGDVRLTFQHARPAVADAAAGPIAAEPVMAEPVTPEQMPQDAPFAMPGEHSQSDGASGEPLQSDDMPGIQGDDDEHTPPDGTYMPEIYRPEGPPQPMITQRDGRWFLRDPRTNREVEIVPKTQAQPVLDEKRKKHLTYAIIGVAALLAVIIIGSALSSRGNEDVERAKQAQARNLLKAIGSPIPDRPNLAEAYNQALLKSIELFQTQEPERIERAVRILNQAAEMVPQRAAARTLHEYIQTILAAGEHLIELDYDRATRLLNNLPKEAPLSMVEIFTTSERDRVDRIYGATIRLLSAKELVGKGELVEAFDTVNSIPVNNAVRIAHEEWIAELSDRCRVSIIQRAQQSFEQRNWKQAYGLYESARRFATTDNQQAELQRMQQASLKAEQDQGVFERAQAEFAAAKHAEAITLLANINADSPYHADAEKLRAQITTERDRHYALALYKAGRAEDAILYIRKEQLQSLFGKMKDMENVLKALEDSVRDDERGEVSEAIKGYERVMALETDTENYYHRTAKRRHGELMADTGARAGEFVSKANEAYKRREYASARRFAKRAFEIDNRSGKDLLDMLDEQARKHYIEGEVHFNRGEKKEAAALYKLATECAEPGSFYHNRALEKLRDLGTVE